MKKAISFILIAVFSFTNAFSFIGCVAQEERADEVRACWVSSVGNLDFPSGMGLSAAALKAEMDEIIKNCRKIGLNTIFFQVRPMGDALYRSEVFPWSVYLSGTQGVAPDQGFDPLAYFVRVAHEAGIALHAWINPYRIGAGENVWEKLSADNPAKQHREYTVTSNSGVYYNPGLPEARSLILDGVAELVRNYDIDGIHFDDYFYPYDLAGFDDSAAYAAYGQGLSLEDFRRRSVDQLVEEVHTLVKTLDKQVQFGISPFGIWANKWIDPAGSDTKGMSSYAAIFSDSKKWVEQGWLDYVCPQIYWSDEHEAAPYDVLVDWWDALCSKNDTKFYVGLALYKVGTDEAGWESGRIMEEQLRYAAAKKSYAGHCFFRYGVMIQNPLGALDSIKSYYAGIKAEVPLKKDEVKFAALPEGAELKITAPQNGATVIGSGISVTGTAAPGSLVTVNGIQAVCSSKGLFAAYVPLQTGSNTLTVRCGSDVKTVRVTRSVKSQLKSLNIETAYPAGEVHRGAGEPLTFQVEAPAGAQVTLTNGTISIPLSATDHATVYTGQWTAPVFPAADKLTLENFRFSVSAGGVNTTVPVDLTLHLYAEGYREEQILQQDAYIFDKSSGGSQMDHDPLRKGTRVTVVALEGSRALLDNGYWVEQQLLGAESVLMDDAANYPYEILNISAKESFGFSSHCNGESLEIRLSVGRMTKLELDAVQSDFKLDLERSVSGGVLRLTSKSGRRIAGYEILPQKTRITICVRFHEDGLKGKTIMLDAGHGGEDTGALGPGGSVYPAESELNLILAGCVKEQLEAAGATVLMMRTADDTVTLEQRVEKTVRQAPDLFISLHHNATDQTSDYTEATGGLMLYSSPLSASLAESLADTLWDGVGEKPVPCRRQSLYVCRQTRYPAVLLEAGYLCNPLEYEMVCQEDIVRQFAKNIVKGLENYFVTVCS